MADSPTADFDRKISSVDGGSFAAGRFFGFQDLASLYRRRRRFLFGTVGGLVALCLTYCLIVPKQYDATSRVALRYFNVFGPYQDPASQYSGVLAVFCRRMLGGEQPVIYGDGEQSRDFTFIQNTVEGNLLAAVAPAELVSGRVMNVATGFRITLNEVFEELKEITGYRGTVAYAPERNGDIKHSLADISLARELLGYAPSVDFREGLRRTVEWYRSLGD